jgi:hypothetical protein
MMKLATHQRSVPRVSRQILTGQVANLPLAAFSQLNASEHISALKKYVCAI